MYHSPLTQTGIRMVKQFTGCAGAILCPLPLIERWPSNQLAQRFLTSLSLLLLADAVQSGSDTLRFTTMQMTFLLNVISFFFHMTKT